MATLCLQDEEMLAGKVKGFPFCMIRVKGFKEKDAVQNAWEKVAESLDFAEYGNFIIASNNWEYFEDSCSEKIGALFCVRNSYKILANQKWLKMYFAEVSTQASIVLIIFISYVFRILLYTYVCTKCTKLFIHVQNVFFMNNSN